MNYFNISVATVPEILYPYEDSKLAGNYQQNHDFTNSFVIIPTIFDNPQIIIARPNNGNDENFVFLLLKNKEFEIQQQREKHPPANWKTRGYK